MKEKTTSVVNVPNLRFPGFSGAWVEKKLGEICEIKTGSQDTQDKNSEGKYPFFVRSNTVERIDKYLYDGEAILTSGDGVGVGKNFHYINGKFGFHQRVYSLRKFQKECYGKFIYSVFSEKFYRRVMRLSAKNSVDSVRMDMISKMPFYFPLLEEQKKIASFLFLIEERISTQSEIIEDYKLLKKGMMQKIFQQELRFKNEEGKFYSKWGKKKLGEVLDYEQPTKFIVNSTEYNDNYNTPVLTAGKSFILGFTNEKESIYKNTPVIIFDDFTMANKFVDFKFKVKSSAMKILKTKNNTINLKFVYESMQMINYPKGDEHKRFWISEYSKIKIDYPLLEEQQKIASTLSAIDNKITLESAYLDKLKAQKKYLLQNMFV